MNRFIFLTIISLLFLTITCIYQYYHFNDGKLHVVFCNVGQGDGILIKTPDNKYILHDAGPDKKILDCLSRHMPLWNRTIDLALLSHPHADHFMGYFFIKDNYHIAAFATEKLDNKNGAFQALMKDLQAENIPMRYVIAGDRWVLSHSAIPLRQDFAGREASRDDEKDVIISIKGPSQEFLDLTSPNGTIGEKKEFASLITHLSYGSFDSVFTGDTQSEELLDAARSMEKAITVLQVPHHGSASGLNEEIVQQLAPKMAVISVGKNSYGHPTKTALKLLESSGVPFKRTDRDGDVEIVSDGIH